MEYLDLGYAVTMFNCRDEIFYALLVERTVSKQTNRKSRRRGDAKTICRHLRHTCVSIFQFHEKGTLHGCFDEGSCWYK